MRYNNPPQKSNNWLVSQLSTNPQVWSTTGTNITLYGGGGWALYARGTNQSAVAVPTVMLNSNIILGGSGTSSAPWYIKPTLMSYRSTPATCSITVSNASTYETSKTLTASVTLNGATLASSPYSWTNGSYTSSSTTSVSSAGAHQLTIKDSNSLTRSCSVTLVSRQEYQHNTCTTANSCSGCPNSSYHATAYYCYYSPAYVTQSECNESDWMWVDGACYQAVIMKQQYNNDAGHCGCATWNTSDTAWYTTSCGNSNYSTCKDRSSRTTYAKA